MSNRATVQSSVIRDMQGSLSKFVNRKYPKSRAYVKREKDERPCSMEGYSTLDYISQLVDWKVRTLQNWLVKEGYANREYGSIVPEGAIETLGLALPDGTRYVWHTDKLVKLIQQYKVAPKSTNYINRTRSTSGTKSISQPVNQDLTSVRNIRRGLQEISRLTKLSIPGVSWWLHKYGYCDSLHNDKYAIPNNRAISEGKYAMKDMTWSVQTISKAIKETV
jgi:hypothetical protein